MSNNQRKNDTLTIRIDSNDKKLFNDIVSEIGLNPTNAVNMFIKTVIKEKSLSPIFYMENTKYDKSIKNLEALEKLLKGINDSNDEILDGEFDEIVSTRMNISRELNL
jgi:addiction module antitoxin, RelB/DinJ family